MALKALIVEDEAALRFIYERLLGTFNWEIRAARDGQQALDILTDYVPDIVLLDMLLPMVSGLQVLQHMAADGRFQRTCVIIASSSKEYEQYTGLMPCCEFIHKPIYPTQLKQLIERVAQQKARS